MITHVALWRRLFAAFFIFTVPLNAIESLPAGSALAYEAGTQGVLGPDRSSTNAGAFQNLHAALSVMQEKYFSLWLGKWTTAIDWTAAVTGTHLSATLRSLSNSFSYTMPGTFDKTQKLDVDAQVVENEINKYFGQVAAYYFGQDHFAIRMQAFDDMLWVVLGWLESVQLITEHSKKHYPDHGDGLGNWHAVQFIPSFAHRARVFYELAEQGWDWKLCGGGMTWNPRLLPYKNAITNQLFISASISMYLNFPGDDNCSPFLRATKQDQAFHDEETLAECSESSDGPIYDPVYLTNAINGYDWLANSGMLNDQGLYTDGFHIKGYEQNHSKTECDERNEMVYTYNQGVILSGLRGLWEATGNLSYLEDGHELIRNVILATGWDARSLSKMPSFTSQYRPKSWPRASNDGWAGLGEDGILTELCDPSATCSQDSQTFKGIFFHHLTAFCEPLPRQPPRKGQTHYASLELYTLHQRSCSMYVPWVTHNAQAALGTRDNEGRFGSWWALGLPDHHGSFAETVIPNHALDYRNDASLLTSRKFLSHIPSILHAGLREHPGQQANDGNDRGRGRTIETQGGGVAVVRAAYELSRGNR